MLGIPNYLYRLLPGNPILLRVVSAAGKRRRDLMVRCAYLGLLTAMVLLALATSGNRYTGEVQFSALTSISARIFQQMSYVQLALVALLAPVFTAGAITQEKDSQTYDILLATPLSNAQIVLGSLLSRLFFVVALLVSGIPIFSITQIFGGVAIHSIVTSFGIAVATAFVTGALAVAIATFKVGTRRTIFSFYLLIVLLLAGGLLLDRIEPLHPVLGVETTASGQPVIDPKTGKPVPIRAQTSWVTAFNPFLSLRSIFGEPDYTPPEPGQLPPEYQRWPLGWILSRPHSFYMASSFALGLVLVLPSIVLLRWIAQSTTSPTQWIAQRLWPSRADTTRRPRSVWHNPIAWREARTKSSAARATLLRYLFIVAGLLGALMLLWLFVQKEPPATFVTPGSYTPAASTVFIQGQRQGIHRITPGTTITLNGQPASAKVLNGDYQVVDFAFRRVGGQMILDSIALADVARRIDARTVRRYLLGAVVLEFVAILLIVTNAAASTVTREKEDGSLDLLLATPITSRYYVWGKLRGLLAFVLPLIAVPVASVLVFVLYDVARGMSGGDSGSPWVVLPESLILLPAMLIVVSSFAAMVGMQMSLRMRTTVRAVMASLGIVLGACAALASCGSSILGSLGRGPEAVAVVLASFSPFNVLTLLIDPYTWSPGLFGTGNPRDMRTGRLLLLFFSLVATGAYAGGVYAMYGSMVKNFDMTIRRQSR